MSNVPFQWHAEFQRKTGDSAAPLQRKFAQFVEKFPVHALVVDDEPLIRWAVAESLGTLGIDVEYAEDAASALKMVTTAALPFELVVLDLRLPDMHDLSLLSTLRQLLPDATLVLMTAFGSPALTDQARALGAAVLNKPFELSELNRIVIKSMADPN
jgi:two-component system NtrC family response regulator